MKVKEIDIRVRRELANKYGVGAEEVAKTLQKAIDLLKEREKYITLNRRERKIFILMSLAFFTENRKLTFKEMSLLYLQAIRNFKWDEKSEVE